MHARVCSVHYTVYASIFMVLYHVPNEALKAKTSGSCIITILISHQTRTWADLDCSYSVDSKSTMPLHSACVGMCVYCQVSRIYAGFNTDYTPCV